MTIARRAVYLFLAEKDRLRAVRCTPSVAQSPFAGGLYSAAAAWSEEEQQRVNEYLYELVQILRDEIREEHQTLVEISARPELRDDNMKQRIQSEQYERLLMEAFGNRAVLEQ